MLCSVEVCKAGIRLFDEKDFKVPGHLVVFQSLRTLSASGQPIDCVTVREFLRKQGSLDLVGGSGAVAELIQFGSDIAPLEYYAKRLKEAFDRP